MFGNWFAETAIVLEINIDVSTAAAREVNRFTEQCKMADKGKSLKASFYRVELNKTDWEVPNRYQNLSPVGSGAYGQVW